MVRLCFRAVHTYKINSGKAKPVQRISGIKRFIHLNYTKMGSSRHYAMEYEDFHSNINESSTDVNLDTGELKESFKEILRTRIEKLLTNLEEEENHWMKYDDYSIYTGTAGIAFMFYQYGKCFNKPDYIDRAMKLLKRCVDKYKNKRDITFLTGTVGPLALNAVILYSQGHHEEAHKMISEIKSLSSIVLNENSPILDELLYGRAGYLYALLFLNANISPLPIQDEVIKQVIALMIKSGNMYAATTKYNTSLMYTNNTSYLGAAHGLAGILYILLQARQYLTESQLEKDIKPALKFLQHVRYPSGNFPSIMGSSSDQLVHWCHGAPGMTMLFCLAHKVYQDENFLETAIQCGDVVWSRGLLRKGNGICHGVAGNAYTFLCLFQVTKDLKYLHRASKFAQWCLSPHLERIPDRPHSLFEGLSGTIYFLIDMQHPLSAKFPAYTI
ncbi:LanC-like protein 2 [Anthophora retusa]